MQKKLLLTTTQTQSRLYACAAILMWGGSFYATAANSVTSQHTAYATIGVEAAPVCSVILSGLANRLVLEDIPRKNGFAGLTIGHVTATCDNPTSRRALAFVNPANGYKTTEVTLTNTSDSSGKMTVWTFAPNGTEGETIGSDSWIVGDGGDDFSSDIIVAQPPSGQGTTVGEYTLTLVAGAYEP